jgi:hypothetical protein
MYYVLSEAIKERMIGELREFWAKDPKYKDSLTPNIQGKYSFEERPQQAIILKSTSATPQRFSADNFQGTVVSYCTLYKAYGKLGTSIEWVREDSRAIQKNAGVFPTIPGIYYIEVRKEALAWKGVTRDYLVFYVDPLLSVIDERPVASVDTRVYTVSQGAFHPGSMVVYEMPGNLPLYEGINYSADSATGIITLVRPLPSGTSLSVDYRYAGTSTGPFPVEENGANNTAIPGVVLAFGRRAYEGDVMAVGISERREEAAREFGGKFEMSVDLDIMARDVYAQGEITDRTLMYLQAQLRDRLSFEGIEIDQVNHGGEAEETYDENEDSYFYTASLSVSLLTDWSIRIPYGPAFTRILQGTVQADQIASALSDDQLSTMGNTSGLRATDQLGLQAVQDPWFRNRTRNYELIR